MHRVKVRVVEDALDANNTIARANRDDFDRHGVTVVNLMSAPGAGKTTLLERALHGLAARAGVLEGDVQGSLDADRLASLHVPVVVINKLDLLPHVDFDMDRYLHHLDAVHPGVETIRLSARTGEGVEKFRSWLERVPVRAPA